MPGMQGGPHNALDPILNDDMMLTMLTVKMMMKIVSLRHDDDDNDVTDTT